MTKNIGFIPELIINHLNENGIENINSLPSSDDATLDDIISYCQSKNKNIDSVFLKKIIYEAVSTGYDKRYLSTIYDNNVRNYQDNIFQNTFLSILKKLKINKIYNELEVIVVGVGNGIEGELLYSKIKKLTITDIAPLSLSRAYELLPHSNALKIDASNMRELKDSFYDLYISLRTYQSTYFNITQSLKEAKRLLNSSGHIILSIACGYINEDKYSFGLFNPHNKQLEEARPEYFVKKIQDTLNQLKFKNIGNVSTPSEIFIYAKT